MNHVDHYIDDDTLYIVIDDSLEYLSAKYNLPKPMFSFKEFKDELTLAMYHPRADYMQFEVASRAIVAHEFGHYYRKMWFPNLRLTVAEEEAYANEFAEMHEAELYSIWRQIEIT